MKPIVGILALQGDFDAHAAAVNAAGGNAVEVRNSAELQVVDALIIPGGESTTMLKLIGLENLTEPLAIFGKTKPIFGTCAGAILLAKEVTHPVQFSFNLMDITVERNAYGRQVDSTIAQLSGGDLQGPLAGLELEAVFIRAPIIRRTGTPVKVLATYNGDPVLVQQGLHMAATFHPELASFNPVHKLFIEGLKPSASKAS